MGEDLVDDLGRVDARDDAQRAATHKKKTVLTHATVFDVDMEDSREPLHPAQGRTTRRMGLAGGVTAGLGMMRRRSLKFGANTPWYRVRWVRGRGMERARCASGTSGAARRAMPNRQDCRFAQPEAALEGCGTRMCRMKFIGSSTTWVVPSPKGCLSGYTTWPRSLTERRSFQTADGGHKHE